MYVKKNNSTQKTFIDEMNKKFYKYPSSWMFDMELQMSLSANSLSEYSGLFHVPEVIGSKENELIFELLDDNTSLRNYFVNSSKIWTLSASDVKELETLFFKVGIVLGEIHSDKSFFSKIEKKRIKIDEKSNPSDLVYLHADFTMSNVLYDNKLDRISIIDWSMSSMFAYPANYGSRYWDLSFFISTLFQSSVSTYFLYNLREKLAKEFLKGYAQKTELDLVLISKKLSKFVPKFNVYKMYREMGVMKTKGLQKLLIKNSESNLMKFSYRIGENL